MIVHWRAEGEQYMPGVNLTATTGKYQSIEIALFVFKYLFSVRFRSDGTNFWRFDNARRYEVSQ